MGQPNGSAQWARPQRPGPKGQAQGPAPPWARPLVFCVFFAHGAFFLWLIVKFLVITLIWLLRPLSAPPGHGGRAPQAAKGAPRAAFPAPRTTPAMALPGASPGPGSSRGFRRRQNRHTPATPHSTSCRKGLPPAWLSGRPKAAPRCPQGPSRAYEPGPGRGLSPLRFPRPPNGAQLIRRWTRGPACQ
jgi:hypothetical protein